MKEVYTSTTTKDIAKKRNLFAVAFGDSITDTAPLQKLIAKYIDAEMIDAIAREHKRGQHLFVGTVNLDAGRSVIWNIGAIAASNYPQKISLIHELLRASAAIPVAFPPVIIPVEAVSRNCYFYQGIRSLVNARFGTFADTYRRGGLFSL